MLKQYQIDNRAQRRRPLDALEALVVRRSLDHTGDEDWVNDLRYVISFARLTDIPVENGRVVNLTDENELHALQVRDALQERLAKTADLAGAIRILPQLIEQTKAARAQLLERLPMDRDSLEAEVCTRSLAVVSGGGGGSGYVYPGCYELLEKSGLSPDLMVGTSIGALTSMFRCRYKRYDPVPQIEAARSLNWSEVFRVMESGSRYGIPATLRVYLRQGLGKLFMHPTENRPLRVSDMEIPLHIVITGVTVDAMKHDLNYFERLINSDDLVSGRRSRARSIMKTMRILREFLSTPNALRRIVVGLTPETEDFDVLDAAGFSASIPGILHYDVLRDDPRMRNLLDNLYANYGITRLGEGGMVANVPSKVAWESAMNGTLGRRNVFVLALDCFAPGSNLAWFPFQQVVRTANVERDRVFSDLYLPFKKTPSPLQLVPSVRDLLLAMRWGREQLAPHIPFVQAMMKPIRPL